MNNAVRGVILGLALMGMALFFFVTLNVVTSDESDFKLDDLAGVLFGGFLMLSCAVIGGAALSGMQPSPPKPTVFSYQTGAVQPMAVQPQGQPYPQPGMAPQPGTAPQPGMAPPPGMAPQPGTGPQQGVAPHMYPPQD